VDARPGPQSGLRRRPGADRGASPERSRTGPGDVRRGPVAAVADLRRVLDSPGDASQPAGADREPVAGRAAGRLLEGRHVLRGAFRGLVCADGGDRKLPAGRDSRRRPHAGLVVRLGLRRQIPARARRRPGHDRGTQARAGCARRMALAGQYAVSTSTATARTWRPGTAVPWTMPPRCWRTTTCTTACC